jgi:hypothetical protein
LDKVCTASIGNDFKYSIFNNSRIYDFSDNNNPLLPATASPPIPIWMGTDSACLLFNGIVGQHYIYTNNNTINFGANSFTINMVFKLNKSLLNQYMFNCLNQSDSRVALYTDAGNKLHCYLRDGLTHSESFFLNSGGGYNVGQWYSLTIVSDADKDSVYSYINNNFDIKVLRITGTMLFNDISLGAASGSSNPAKVNIAYINIFNRALSIANIIELNSIQHIPTQGDLADKTMFMDGLLNIFGTLTGKIE